MRSPHQFVAAAAATLFAVAVAQKCGANANCPASAPCCSAYGQCGIGAYCLGGCDPKFSYDLQSCVAAPVCKSGNYGLKLGKDIQPNTRYLGDPSETLWVSSGTPANYQDDSILLTMPPSSVGTLLSSTHYVWYGKITAQLTTSQGAGVVTAFILMSDMKDEIDFEFVGADLEHAQSNYYFQGITDYGNGGNLSTTNTRTNMHTYEIDWKPDYISWAIDGKVLRTVYRKDTYNDQDKLYHFPQSPSRVQLSLWPAGLQSNGQGTIDWAGGLVDWNSQYMQNGYYFAQVKSINVECYDPPSGYKNNGNKVYYYTSRAGTQNDVSTGNNDTVMASFYGTGDDLKKDPNGSASKGASAPASTSSTEPQTVPGLSGGGIRSDGAPGTDADLTPNTDNSNGAIGITSFSQGGSSGAGKLVAGSAVALLGFFAAALLS